MIPEDKKIRIFYKSRVQDGNNPDPANMFNMKAFDFADDAYQWFIKNEDMILEVIVTKKIGLMGFVTESR